MRIYCEDIRVEFDIEKCAIRIIKSEKLQMAERIELPSQGKIRTLGEMGTYKYLGIMEVLYSQNDINHSSNTNTYTNTGGRFRFGYKRVY